MNRFLFFRALGGELLILSGRLVMYFFGGEGLGSLEGGMNHFRLDGIILITSWMD